MKLLVLLLSTAAVVPLFAQAPEDEAVVIAAALKYHVEATQAYIPRWILADTTTSLTPNMRASWPDEARVDFLKRNAESLRLLEMETPESVVQGDLSRFWKSDGFDWTSFSAAYPGVTPIWFSRPGFSDSLHAVVRLNIGRDLPKRITTGTYNLVKDDQGWSVVGGEFPVVEPRAN